MKKLYVLTNEKVIKEFEIHDQVIMFLSEHEVEIFHRTLEVIEKIQF